MKRHELLHQLLVDARLALTNLAAPLLSPCRRAPPGISRTGPVNRHPWAATIGSRVAQDRELAAVSDRLLPYQPLGKQIETFGPIRRIDSAALGWTTVISTP